MGTMLAERREVLPASASPTTLFDNPDIPEWPIAGAGSGCNGFLADLGIQDALIAFKPVAVEPRSLFLVGMHGLRRHGTQLYRLVRLADHIWARQADVRPQILDLSALPDDIGWDGDRERPAMFGCLPSPLDGFGQAIVARQITAEGRLDLLLLRRRSDEPLRQDAVVIITAALPLFLDAMLAFCIARRHEQRSALMHTMFDQMTLPTLLVDEQACPMIANAAAVALLDRRDVLFRGSDGLITARSPRENRALRSAILNVSKSRGRTDDSDMSAVRLTDRFGQWLLAAAVLARSCREDHGVRPAVMIVIHQPAVAGAPACILSALGLLPSEQRFLDQFLRSNTLVEAAERSGLSRETARTYLKRVRAKLGAHRQMDLARLIYGLIPPLSTDTLSSADGS